MYNQLLGWWVANQNQSTKQKHSSLNAQGHRNWIRQRNVGATGHTRGRWQPFSEERTNNSNLSFMKPIKKLSFIINILMLFCLVSIQAQVAMSSKNVIGEWTYLGPDSLKVNDKIILDRALSDEINTKRWVFNPKNEFILKVSFSKEKYNIGYMSKGDKWLLDVKSNSLRITRNNVTQYFEITSFQETKLILTRIK